MGFLVSTTATALRKLKISVCAISRNYNAAGTLGKYVAPSSSDALAFGSSRSSANGTWFSFNATSEGTYWRNAKVVKAINADCHASALTNLIHTRGKDCFDGCPPGSNASSECYASCIFDTTLGKGSGSSATPVGGIPLSDIISAWLQGFESNDPSTGGCPACPESGQCPPPKHSGEGQQRSDGRRGLAPRRHSE